MNQYIVRHVANLEDSVDPRYRSAFMAYNDEDEWVGELNHIDAKVSGGPRLSILIHEEVVQAPTAIAACQKFKKWMYEGLDKSFLIGTI